MRILQDAHKHTLTCLCGTQAQECVYHKAVIDGKSPALLARLAKQQHIMYLEMERCFGTKAMEAYFDKSWLVGWDSIIEDACSRFGGCLGTKATD